ncbi:MAG: Sec-independent protein translocase protein TatB [Gammaproteobacteria bacterium]|nr:Sec-independent protein translocase protein TatB [Gammaproteobacteria bacterium]
MFDIGFMEMALIGVVALVVIGPERLPGVAKTVGQWIGSARRFMNSVQADINLEVSKTDELKRLLDEQINIQSAHEILEQTPAKPDNRKPVPRAIPSQSATSDPQETSAEQKPEHPVKMSDDVPPADNDSGVSDRPSNNKHD